jgi:Tfp pilus assembly protein PilO
MSNIISILLIAASLGGFFMYVDPTYMEIKKAQAEKSEYTRALDNSKQLQRERDKFLEKYNAADPKDMASLLKLLPDNIDNVRLIIDIDEMAKDHKLPIGGFKAETSAENSKTIGASKSNYGTLTLSFSISASYNAFLAFMGDLEKSLRILDITSISFNPSDVGSVYDYNVTIKTYWLK